MVETKTRSHSIIKIAIVDDDKSYIDSLKNILDKEERIKIYGEYYTARDFIHSMDSPFRPTLCLMDVVLPDMSGIECSKIIKKKYPEIHFIIMTAYPEVNSFAEARVIGADYVEKGTCIEFLMDKIVTINRKEADREESRVISLKNSSQPAFKSMELIEKLENSKQRVSSLSNAQKKVLVLRKKGKTMKEIAELMGIGTGTVNTHLSRAIKKLELPDLLNYIIDDDLDNE